MSKKLSNSLTVIGLAAALALAGCGTPKEQKTVRGTGGINNPSLPPSSQGPLAECTRVANNTPGLTGQLATYYYSGQIVNDYLQMNIAVFPAAQFTSTAYAQLYRWKEPTAGNRTVNSIPVRFYYVDKYSGATLNSSPLNLISRSSIQNLIDTLKLDKAGTTVTNFFSRYYLILTGMEMQWEAMTIAFYDSSQGTASISSADVLLPPFIASPLKYSASVTVPSLVALHPLNDQINSGASDAEFKRLTEDICLELFSSVRSPASIEAEEPLPVLGRIWAFIKSIVSKLF